MCRNEPCAGFLRVVREFERSFRLQFSPEARAALWRGCCEDDGVAQMEALGLPPHLISCLDAAGVIYLWELLALDRFELKRIPQVSVRNIEHLCRVLSQYDKLASVAGFGSMAERVAAYGPPKHPESIPPVIRRTRR